MAQVISMRPRMLARAIALVVGLAALPALATGQDPMRLDQQAREAAWAGRTAEALHLLDQHLAQHPDDRAARLDRARWLAWNGDYAASIETLDALGGDDDEARALRARVLAWAGRRDASLALNAPLYAAQPDNYDIAWTQTLAERMGQRPERALDPLERVRQLQPDAKDTRDIAKVVRLPLYSHVGMPASVYSDSDDIEIRGVGLDADLRVSDTVRLLAEVAERTHEAELAGPFAPILGGDSLDETRISIGARFALSPDTAVEAWVGRSELDFDTGADDGNTIGRLAFTHRASDAMDFTVTGERDRVAVSPRAMSLDILRNTATVDMRFTPTLRDTIAVRAAADDYTDDNERHALSADWRHAIHRSGTANVDVGLQAEWQGYTDNPGNGYYSPDNYRRIAPVVSSYIALGPEAGLYLGAAVGVQRDETFENWKRASDVSAALTLGIFSHWQLVATAGYSERLNEFGSYNGRSFGLQMRYRFCEFNGDRCPR
jgi:tetratricopeptide (TPR) repeat protein